MSKPLDQLSNVEMLIPEQLHCGLPSTHLVDCADSLQMLRIILNKGQPGIATVLTARQHPQRRSADSSEAGGWHALPCSLARELRCFRN